MDVQVLQLARSNFTKRVRQFVTTSTGWQIALPSRVSIAPTLKCVMRCKQCDIWKLRLEDAELSTPEWEKILSDLQSWLGPFHLNVTGGEPFLRKDILELLGFCSQIGISVGIVTNGYLISDDLAKRILSHNLLNVNISLDGAVAETHDHLRGVKGAYQKALVAIESLVRARREMNSRTRLVLKTTLLQHNLAEIPALLELAEQKGLDGIFLQPLDENLWAETVDPQWFEKSDLWAQDVDAMDSTVDMLIAAQENGAPILNSLSHLRAMKTYFRNPNDVVASRSKPCPVGLQNFDISYNGDVRFCDYMPVIGNVRTASAATVWNSPEAQRVRQLIRDCKRPCLATCHLDRTVLEQARIARSLFVRRRVS